MATIRHSLQRDVFEPTEERLIGVLYVTKPGKKKKTSFLCATINKEKPVYATVHQVKKTDKDVYKKKNSWPLRELQVVDGRDENKDTADLDLTFDRIYKWVANSAPDKHAFIQVLWKLCCRYLPKQKPQFINIPAELIEENINLAESGDVTTSALDNVDAALEDDGDYRALSEKEQMDLERLMEQCDSAVSNAEAFAEQLSRDLSVLDGANIHSMMASEAQVEALMVMIDSAYTEAEKIETRLDSYDEILLHVKDSIEKMADKNTSIEQTNANNSKLLEELDRLINQLDLPRNYVKDLYEPDLNKAGMLPQAIQAAAALQLVINAPISSQLSQLQAVQDEKKRFDKLRGRFSQIVSRHLNNLFIHLGNDPGETLSLHAEQLTLPRHGSIHTELLPYTPLMHWIRALDHRAYQHLNKTYATSISKLYERDIRLFFEEARQRISGGRRLRGSGSSQDIASMSGVAGKLTSQIKHGAQTLGTRTNTGALLGVDRDQWGSELDMQERQKFDEIFERVLSELQPVCLSEQEFCIAFFNLNATGNEKAPSSVASTPGSSGSEESSGSAGTSSGAGLIGTPGSGHGRPFNREVRSMMAALFTTLEQQLASFINTYDRADSYCCLYIYVRLSEHVLTAEDTGSFLCTTFGSCLVQAKRNFDRFMNSQLQSIQECRVARKKCGIIPFIINFEEFAKTAESVFKKSERRADLDKWYVRLVLAMFEYIPRVASEHQRTPPEVIKMENYHVLHQLMFQLKLPGMDTQKKEAKQRYQEALSAYVTQYFGRPLEKLNQFFDGVTNKVASGVKESEVGYQLAFSKQELRKVIKEYPGKEVKRGLDQLYKKVEKHLSEEGNLLQVVWRAMQEEFIRQYKLIEDLIHRCYPGAMINLEFSIDDILNYFSDIALSH
ncbi:exocyst complex component 1-like [Homarus americanus]|uniref:exocyst complex component 1-like n=1 Tax=Homarus americanus TaxID=6706 RepID=UPI001C43C1FA|nr:exocyst complex component 1-like [Homarus americanus]XP_042208282.1 exocyst complex component 1-like [Homarus americanus]XP_042208283.1 exocyst complex component 1-like [Homarus americanus]